MQAVARNRLEVIELGIERDGTDQIAPTVKPQRLAAPDQPLDQPSAKDTRARSAPSSAARVRMAWKPLPE
jgi:hypothetical protein